jgi:hypothetical protein
MPRLLRIALVLLLASILATTAVLADPFGGTQPRRSAIVASTPMDFIAQLWSFLNRVWSKNGSQVDPSGIQIKNRSQADPDGRSLPSTNSTTKGDNGSQADPNG